MACPPPPPGKPLELTTTEDITATCHAHSAAQADSAGYGLSPATPSGRPDAKTKEECCAACGLEPQCVAAVWQTQSPGHRYVVLVLVVVVLVVVVVVLPLLLP